MTKRLVINGSKARQLRRDAKLTQEEAAVQVEIAGSSLRRIEAGNVSVQLTTLGKLSRLYEVNPDDLLSWI